VVGYIEGEGMFFVNIYKRKDTVLGEGVKLVFKVTQDRKNIALLESFTNVFTVGKVYKQSPTVKVMDFMITGLASIKKNVFFFIKAALARWRTLPRQILQIMLYHFSKHIL
jgi:hypothetical protein